MAHCNQSKWMRGFTDHSHHQWWFRTSTKEPFQLISFVALKRSFNGFFNIISTPLFVARYIVSMVCCHILLTVSAIDQWGRVQNTTHRANHVVLARNSTWKWLLTRRRRSINISMDSGWQERKKEQTNHHASGLNECACEMVFGEPSNYHTYCANRNRQPEDAAVWDAAAAATVTGPERGAASACNICKSLIYSADDRPGLVHLFMFSQCPLFVPAAAALLSMRSHSTNGSPQINAGSVQFAVKLEYPGTATNCCGQFIIAAVITNWQE